MSQYCFYLHLGFAFCLTDLLQKVEEGKLLDKSDDNSTKSVNDSKDSTGCASFMPITYQQATDVIPLGTTPDFQVVLHLPILEGNYHHLIFKILQQLKLLLSLQVLFSILFLATALIC